jgi:hypothetical protein
LPGSGTAGGLGAAFGAKTVIGGVSAKTGEAAFFGAGGVASVAPPEDFATPFPGGVFVGVGGTSASTTGSATLLAIGVGLAAGASAAALGISVPGITLASGPGPGITPPGLAADKGMADLIGCANNNKDKTNPICPPHSAAFARAASACFK